MFITPSPNTGSFNSLNWLGGGTEGEVKGEDCQGGGGKVGGGNVKGQSSVRPVGTLVFRERMRKAPAVQSGRARPMGRCASPPWTDTKPMQVRQGQTIYCKCTNLRAVHIFAYFAQGCRCAKI